MSHHLDSPIARQDIRLDITDLYVFRGETGTVFAINVCHSIFGPIPAPGYHPEGMYEFKVDLNGDAIEDVTYRFVFQERDAQGNQTYVVLRLTGADATDPAAQGTIVAQGETGETTTTPTGLRVWAGKAGDPFWIEPDVLHAVGHALQDGTTINLAGWDRAKAKISSPVTPSIRSCSKFRTRNSCLTQPTIAALASGPPPPTAGGWRRRSRDGLPMIHPLFTQFNEDLGNRLNAGRPADDLSTHGKTVAKAIAGVVSAYGTTDDPQAYGENVARRFCPNLLPTKSARPPRSAFWSGTVAP